MESDNILTGIFVVIAAASIWRGITRLEDDYFFPENPNFSILSSILLGVGILAYKGKDIKTITG
tara:strand:+ start:310 stop:501 length:192 start_codon:yes stop_codon:yes gene_type:complete